MRLPRITCRTLMIAVALAALTTRGYMLWRRSAEFAAKADEHYMRRWRYRTNLSVIALEKWKFTPRGWDAYEARRVLLERCERHEDQMYKKYRRATLFPWVLVTPDPGAPPEPSWGGSQSRPKAAR